MSIIIFVWGVVMMVSSTAWAGEYTTAEKGTKPQSYLLSFTDGQGLYEWQVTNDGVMGGLSVGKTQLEEQNFIFYGHVSTENNGGFTSVYRPVATMSAEFESVKIAVKGDGKSYQLRMRNKVMGYNLVYKISFDTKADVMQTLTFKLADFRASFRGRIISDAPVLKAQTISHVGFLITTQQNSQFSLSASEIEFY
jgi:hypothetical protein